MGNFSKQLVFTLSLAWLFSLPVQAQLPNLPKIKAQGLFPEEKLDSDGDTVADIDDNCPGTPPTMKAFGLVYDTPVDSCGCPLTPCQVYDSDKDGVFDCYDACPNTRKGAKVDKRGCPLPIMTTLKFNLDVKFAFAEAVVLPDFVPDLDRLKQILIANPNITLQVEGHTDSVGSVAYNRSLSQVRAQVVRRYLLADSRIAANRISALGFGKSQPVASNTTDKGRALNRRTVAALTFNSGVAVVNTLSELQMREEDANQQKAEEVRAAQRRAAALTKLASPIPTPTIRAGKSRIKPKGVKAKK